MYVRFLSGKKDSQFNVCTMKLIEFVHPLWKWSLDTLNVLLYSVVFYSVLMRTFQLTCITNNGWSTTNIQPMCTIEIYSSVGWWWIKKGMKYTERIHTPTRTVTHRMNISLSKEARFKASDWFDIARISIVSDGLCVRVCLCNAISTVLSVRQWLMLNQENRSHTQHNRIKWQMCSNGF